ncbi:ELM1/GtrOC1 family putative glycosyltransferase [Wenzhouxiangella marina]|uniref:Mitochondrial fission ELM1 protein n=1 Tax=Wenzhouxiangella marina TaxID=1579979 RepID=A0A0K0XVT5_9GAMM|nr:ELM1/GtrOC1 family putative glycosyltransferase [Wenzhouxiangella marina]AKS41819.1 Mitochondrial fission ELM1 protein [Wenzhouxiangella marina]MBB6086419.1 hypothetical protein [Wenzhouxiangella marina]
MALLIQRIARGLTPALFSADRPPARQNRPDRIVLGVKPGQRPSDKPPVRIFLGTERGQFRAEHVFLWSIEKHRDPARIYEIYLLRDLKGFRRSFWLTGFTNYRFAIPEFAGFEGRAIYNDADQVYLTDPAELFDTDMAKAGFLSINDRDTSVMLIDCKRMAEVWNPHDVRRLKRKALEARARQARLWGDLDDGWNARDSEYSPGESKLVHFTTLHTQPWQPFPGQFVYYPNPTHPLWPELEAEALSRDFMPVSATRPSRDWPRTKLKLSSRDDGESIQALLSASRHERQQASITVRDWLTEIPDADVPWVLSRLFASTPELTVNLTEPFSNRTRYRRTAHFWLQQLQMASRRHPNTRWLLNHRSGLSGAVTCSGGPADEGDILVLLHRKPGHNQQARAIAEELGRQTGRPVREHRIESTEAGFAIGRLFGRSPEPPELDTISIVVAGGWLPTRYARALARQRPRLRLILSGRKAGPPPEHGGVVIQCRHFGLPAAPRRLLSLLPLNRGQADHGGAREAWSEWLEAPRRAALLIGGASKSHRFSADDARRLAATASAWAAEQKARLLVVTSRRSLNRIGELKAALGEADLLYVFQPGDENNPYRLALEHSDELVVTGESESMLADAASRGKGFLVWPLSRRPDGAWSRLSRAIADKATRPRFNRRGSIRPQQGLTYLCARWVERNWILPPRDTNALLKALYDQGLAAPFGQPAPASFRPSSECEALVRQARGLLAIQSRAEAADAAAQLTLI